MLYCKSLIVQNALIIVRKTCSYINSAYKELSEITFWKKKIQTVAEMPLWLNTHS